MTVDVSLFQPGTPAVQALAAIGGGGFVISGPGKLAQRFVVRLLTETGSMTFSQADGTQFIAMLKGGSCCSWEIVSAFAIATLDMEIKMGAEETDADPDDEKYAGAELKQIVLTADDAVLVINVKNQAGTSDNVLLPLSFVLNP